MSNKRKPSSYSPPKVISYGKWQDVTFDQGSSLAFQKESSVYEPPPNNVPQYRLPGGGSPD